MDDNELIRKSEYYFEEEIKDIQKRRIGNYLNELKKNGDDYKIKHIKNLYQIYIMLNQTKKVIIRNEDFNIDNISINDFYSYISYNIISLREEIYSYINLFQDKNFDNYDIIKNRKNCYIDYKSLDETLYDELIKIEKNIK